MTSLHETVERLGAVFAETFHIDAPAPDADLLDSGILDSFQFVELLYQLETQFAVQIQIDDVDLEDLRSLERIAGLIIRKQPPEEDFSDEDLLAGAR